ncbi:MAG: hypothetical protein RLZZ537_188 [Pseudomonadota bacterium]|jgi:hypothetical protein
MPRKTPTNVLELRGSFKKHPERRAARANEPKPTGSIGDPPEHLKPQEQDLWREIVGIVAPGVLANSDRLVLEITSVLMAEFRILGTAGMTDGRLSRLSALLGQLGMTPADRARVNVPMKAKAVNPFTDF